MVDRSSWSTAYIGSTSSKNSTQMTQNSDFCQTFSSAVRALSQSNDIMMKGILEQNKSLNDAVKVITDQMREITLVNKQLTSTNKSLVEELKSLKNEATSLKLEKSIKSETPSLNSQTTHKDQIGQQNFSNSNRLSQSAFQTSNIVPCQQFPTNLQYGLQSPGQSFNQLAQNYLSTMMNLQQVHQPQQQASTFQPQVLQPNLTLVNPTPAGYQQPAVPIFDLVDAPQISTGSRSTHFPTAFSSQNVGHPSIVSSAPAAKPSPFSGIPATVQQKAQPPMSTGNEALKPDVKPFFNGHQRTPAAATPEIPKQQPPPTFAQVAAMPKTTTPNTTAAPTFNSFTSLSFGKPSTTVTTIATSTPPIVTSTAPVKGIALGGSGPFSSSSGLTFAQLASSSTTDKKPTASAGFFGAGQPVFGSLALKDQSKVREKVEGDEENEAVEDFVPTAEFKPLVPLPALVEVKTGEEDEEVLFKERAKLFRFDQTTNEFKERGVGELKLLKNARNGRVRLLMRRDQTLKLCANHHLNDAMKLLPLAKSDKAFTWQCQDFSDNELKPETLAVRFKNVEMAQKFKNIFDTAASQATSSPSKEPEKKDGKDEKVGGGGEEVKTGFGDEFKAKAGSWNCHFCYLNNMSGRDVCISCGGSKDGSVANQAEPAKVDFNFTLPKTTPSADPTFSFNFGKITSSPAASDVAQTFGSLQKQVPQNFTFGFQTPPNNKNNSTTSSSIFGNSPAASPLTKSTSIFQNSAAFGSKLFGATKNNDSQKPPVTETDADSLPTDCKGCIGCTLKETEVDEIFEQLERAALDGPQYPAYEDSFDDSDLMVKLEHVDATSA